ncbi:DNA polymerase alpha subunit B [Nosema granulosis]|uniref:DNA polymerase alpha subunit B n=1 Tax=Nosema granulosis TaxID=83296 RepID=A0A9P6L0B4_9MICR|nr:DNA polymerase alpha subunit B [Nosema granulosis]
MNLEDKIFSKLEKNKRNEVALRVISKIKPGYFYLKKEELHSFVKNKLEFMEQGYLELLGLESFEPFNYVSKMSHYIFGMIKVIDSNNIMIFSNIKGNNDVSLNLNMEHLQRYSVFSGQVVALRGKNVGNNEFIVENIQCMPMVEINTEKAKGSCKIKILSGDIDQVTTENVDVIVLIGVDLSRFKEPLENWAKTNRNNKVLVVPTLDDDYSVNVFPQIMQQDYSPYFETTTNPVEMLVNGKLISINTLDILQELKEEEVSLCSGNPSEDPCGDVLFKGDQIDRLCYHALFQKTYLPTIPSKYNVQYDAGCLSMRVCPDVYILKSKLVPFERKIGPTKVINLGNNKVTEIEINL